MYQQIIRRLQPLYGVGEARAIVRMVLEERFGLSLTDIMLGKVNELSSENLAELEKIIVRLEKNEPIQYILGSEYFCGHKFHVAPGVLIPRPETEELVQQVIKNIMPAPPSLPERGGETTSEEPDTILSPPLSGRLGGAALLDIGTGSGCIAISIALALKEAGIDCDVEAWDISTDALAIARKNAEQLGADVTFRQVDVLAPHSSFFILHSSFDFIVSNPPYICRREAAAMERNVLDYEPDTALFVPDDDPLLFYRAIARLGTTMLTERGRLYFEINRAYGPDTCRVVEELGYHDVRLIKDQFNNDRIVTALWQKK